MSHVDEAGMLLLAEGARANDDKGSCNQLRSVENDMNVYVHGVEHDVKFQGREKTQAQHLANAQATVIGAAKLIERALTGDPAQALSNANCAAYWLRLAADELDALKGST